MSTGGPESLRLSPDLSPLRPLIEPTPRLHSEIVLNGYPLQIYALELRYCLELTAHVPDWKTRVGEIGHEGDTYLMRQEIPFNKNGKIGHLTAITTRKEPMLLCLVKIERTTDILPPDSSYSTLSGVRHALLYSLYEIAREKEWDISGYKYINSATKQWLIDNELRRLLPKSVSPDILSPFA